MIKILTLCVYISFFHANTTHHYQVEFMGIDVANVSMAYRDTVFANHLATVVEFSARTEAISNFFYPVDNYYEIIHSIDTHQILSFRKITTQPGLNSELFTDLKDSRPYYHDSDVSIAKDTITIFTLFYLMAHDLLGVEKFTIEREGLNYEASLLKLSNELNFQKYMLNLRINSSPDKMSILQQTDIFTWAVFKKNAARSIWVNTSEKPIEKCIFDLGLINLTAKYLFTDE